MARIRKVVNARGCIVLDARRQTNTAELLELIRTIDGARIEDRPDNTWVVHFPIKRVPHVTHKGKAIHRRSKLWYLQLPFVRKDSDNELEKHYCAIMLK